MIRNRFDQIPIKPCVQIQSKVQQKGGMTIFAAVILLSLMSLMLFYSTRTQQAEQRTSANEYRQKLAFHAAESGVQQAIEYMLANNSRVLSAEADAAPDGAGGVRAGWFNDPSKFWTACPATAGYDQPCGGLIGAGNGVTSYFYDDLATTNAGEYDSIPMNIDMLPPDSTVRVSAVICQVDFSSPTGSCLAAPVAGDEESQGSFIMTILSYGYADCTDISNTDTCLGASTIALPLTNFNLARGAPTVPLTTRTTFPPTGTAEIVPNPNAGGVGVPVSVWANNNASCSTGAPLLLNGNWATCEYHEWYETDEIPESMTCSQPSCSCSKPESISYTVGLDDRIGIDLLEDTAFPCDLFAFFFGIARSQYQVVKSAARVIGDCDGLNAESYGIYWVSGAECRLDGTNTIGTPARPVMLISAALSTTFTGDNNIFGVVYITDIEAAGATWRASGNNIVFGAMIIDAELDAFLGTFQIIYNKDVSSLAPGSDGIGTLSGGWRDFGLPVLSWET